VARAGALLAGVALLAAACEQPQTLGDPNSLQLQAPQTEQAAPPVSDPGIPAATDAEVPGVPDAGLPSPAAPVAPAGPSTDDAPAVENTPQAATETVEVVSTDTEGELTYEGHEHSGAGTVEETEKVSVAEAAAVDPDAPDDGGHDHKVGVEAGMNSISQAIANAQIDERYRPQVEAAFQQISTAVIQAVNQTGALNDNYVSFDEILQINQYLQTNYPEWDGWRLAIQELTRDKRTTAHDGMSVGNVATIVANLGSDYSGQTYNGTFRPKNGADRTKITETGYTLNKLFGPDGPHSFVAHALALLGTDILAPGQQPTGGFERIDDNTIRAMSPITGLRPVIEQAIDQVLRKNKNLSGEKLESAVANQLTQLNDWNQLTSRTQDAVMMLSGIDFDSMSKQEQELTINHLQHSPLPFGDMTEVLSPNVTIDYGYTHTLDKNRTRVQDLGNGQFRIFMISNNNNGSHTGHSLGAFVVQTEPGTTAKEAKQIGNNMVQNKNNNNRLYLAESAKAILYGQTPHLDFSGMTEAEKASLYQGNTL